MATNNTALEFKVQGMDCANCAKSIESAVARMDGVQQCDLNFTTETLRVTGTARHGRSHGRCQQSRLHRSRPPAAKRRAATARPAKLLAIHVGAA